jgi:hypothetical protein
MAHGGARPGAGRPKGSKNEVKPDKRAELIAKYYDPLERLLSRIADENPETKLDDKDRLEFCVKALPFLHPKLGELGAACHYARHAGSTRGFDGLVGDAVGRVPVPVPDGAQFEEGN